MALTVALVYDLKSDYEGRPDLHPDDLAELDDEDVIQGLEQALVSLGHKPVRVGNLTHLVSALAAGQHHDWHLVWNIAEGFHGSARESQVPGLLEAWQIPCTFSDAATLAIVHDKTLTKIVLDHHGVANAPFAVLRWQQPFEARSLEQWRACFPQSPIFTDQVPAMFVKPASEGSSKGIYDFNKASSVAELNAAVEKLRARFPQQDLLVETFLSGREYTISLLGTGPDARVLGTIEHVFAPGAKLDFFARSIKGDDAVLQTYMDLAVVDPNDPEVKAAEQVSLEAWRALGCRDAGRVDIRCQGTGAQARPFVMEVNALAGMRREGSAITKTSKSVGMSYESLVQEMLLSAAKRIRR